MKHWIVLGAFIVIACAMTWLSIPDASTTHSVKAVPVVITVEAPSMQTVPKALTRPQKLNLTSSQYNYLMLAKKIGKPYSLSQALMGIMWKETRAGKFGPIGNQQAPFGQRTYGIMQIKLKTAMYVIHAFPKMFPDYQNTLREIVLTSLLTNPKFNIRVALGYCLLLQKRGLTWREMITAYNLGYEGAKEAVPQDQTYTHDIIHSVRSGMIARLNTTQ